MQSDRPNILFFLSDQHRHDWLGHNPDLPLRTPVLDGLAASGVRFTRACCTSPLCAPSRASLASGVNYDNCGVPDNRHDYPLEQPTYYQALRDAGYRVAGVGKFDLHKDVSDPADLDWHLDGSRLLAEWGFTDGIDNEGKLDGSNSYRAAGGPRGPYLSFLQRRGLAEAYVREHTDQARHKGAYITTLPDDAYCDNWLSENGRSLLKRFGRQQPWHLVVNFVGPHSPMDVTAAMRSRWESVDFPLPHGSNDPDPDGLLRIHQNCAATIENIDMQIGRFLDLLEERGEIDNTIIFYASDHGEMLGDHGLWGKSVWYQPSVGVPLVIAGPGMCRGGVSTALVSLHDLAATFLDYTGAPRLPDADALSLRPVLEDPASPHREYLVSGLADWRILFDGKYKLVSQRAALPLLFDLGDDPFEDCDIAAEWPDVVKHLLATLDRQCPRWSQGQGGTDCG